MKTTASILCVAILILGAVAAPIAAYATENVPVHAHITKSGHYVAPHMRTAPNHTRMDNFSTKGNVNPYTGKKGTKN